MKTTEQLTGFVVGGWYVVENDRVCYRLDFEDWSAMVRALGLRRKPEMGRGETTGRCRDNDPSAIQEHLALAAVKASMRPSDSKSDSPSSFGMEKTFHHFVDTAERMEKMEAERLSLVRYWAKRWLWYGGAIGLAMVSAAAILRRW